MYKQGRLRVYYNKISFGTSEQVHPAEGARWCRREESPTTLKRTTSSGGGNFQRNTLYKRVTCRLAKIKHACVVDLSQYFARLIETVLVFSSVTGKCALKNSETSAPMKYISKDRRTLATHHRIVSIWAKIFEKIGILLILSLIIIIIIIFYIYFI